MLVGEIDNLLVAWDWAVMRVDLDLTWATLIGLWTVAHEAGAAREHRVSGAGASAYDSSAELMITDKLPTGDVLENSGATKS